MKTLIPALLALALLMPAAARADALSDAKAAGLVGERPDGYLAPVQAPSLQIQQLVDRINAERRQAYAGIAAKNGTSVEAVGAITAERVRREAPAGTFFMDAGGAWRRK
ncbi:MAG TPA: YdbL family protein [Alphaproteobacteria bacterium]|nr:YdbL family protein [Alphaproteobacteria bacterium]